MEKLKPRTLSGFMELLPAPQQKFERMLEILRRTFALYGFTPIDTPVIESADILLAKGGGETEKQIYRFQTAASASSIRQTSILSATASCRSSTRPKFRRSFIRSFPNLA